MKITHTIRIALALVVIGVAAASVARADEWNKKTILTFSQPVEVSGHVLPAGTYTFMLLNTTSDRNIVQIFNADGTRLITTVMAIPDSRLTPTDETVIRFGEVPTGSPEVIRGWFYPGNKVGQAFVYPKVRAMLLAKASKTAVPAIADDTASVDELKAAPIVAVTPDEQEVPLAQVMPQTAPAPLVATTVTEQTDQARMVGTAGRLQPTPATELPKTASSLPLVVSLGLGAIGVAVGLMLFGRRAFAPSV